MDSIQNQYKAAKTIKKVTDIGNSVKEKANKTSEGLKERSQSSSSIKRKKSKVKDEEGNEPLLESGANQDNEDIVSNRSARSGSNSAKAEPTKSKPSAEMANYKQMIYLFVARDSEMFVFEHHIEK